MRITTLSIMENAAVLAPRPNDSDKITANDIAGVSRRARNATASSRTTPPRLVRYRMRKTLVRCVACSLPAPQERERIDQRCPARGDVRSQNRHAGNQQHNDAIRGGV